MFIYEADLSPVITRIAQSSPVFKPLDHSSFSGIFGQSTNATDQYTRGLGRFSTTTANLPSSVAISEIQGAQPAYIRPPLFYVVSQTF